MLTGRQWMIAITFVIALFFVFLVMKLASAVAWGWLWVCAPLWIGGCLFGAGVVVALIAAVMDQRRNRQIARARQRRVNRKWGSL